MASKRFAALGALVAATTMLTVATSRALPDRLTLHLALFVGAGAAWAATLALLKKIPRQRRDVWLIAIVALALRLPAWVSAPAHSDDVYRYAWDGRVARAGINPYRYPPNAPALASLRDGAAVDNPRWERGAARPTDGRAPLWARVNNADLPTIYPPAAQIVFFVAAWLPLPPVAALKLLLAACDLGLLALLLRMLRRRGDDPRFAIAWGWSPLVAIELSQNAHLEALPLVAVVAALALWDDGRRTAAGLLLGVAAAAKLIGLPLLPAFRSWRAWLAALVAAGLLALPFAGAGRAIAGSTGEFARRWRGNDGAYALIQAATDRAVCALLDAPPTYKEVGPQCGAPLDLWPHQALATILSGRTYRASVYPDELSNFAARAIAALAVLSAIALVAWRRLPPLAGVEWIFGALLLFAPALHPWYATWLLPLAALTRRRAFIALAVLAPLGYAPLAGWHAGAPWRDPIWTRAVEHGLAWALLAADWASARRAARNRRIVDRTVA